MEQYDREERTRSPRTVASTTTSFVLDKEPQKKAAQSPEQDYNEPPPPDDQWVDVELGPPHSPVVKRATTHSKEHGSTTSPVPAAATTTTAPSTSLLLKTGIPKSSTGSVRRWIERFILYGRRDRSMQFAVGAGGILVSYLVHGYFQEDLFAYVSPHDGRKFTFAWFLQCIESLVNVLFAYMFIVQQQQPHKEPDDDAQDANEKDDDKDQEPPSSFYQPKELPLCRLFAVGTVQLFAKTFTNMSLAAGLSFPVCTLSKSAKMVPVMMGQLAVGGSTYTCKDYVAVGAIVSGTVLLSLGSSSPSSSSSDDTTTTGGSSTTLPGVAFILLALAMDGVTAGLQSSLKLKLQQAGQTLDTYDMMFWVNVSICVCACVISIGTGEWSAGMHYLQENPPVLAMIGITCLYSVVGQSSVYFVITQFDTLACTTVTTSRKMLTVLYSLVAKGHALDHWGVVGVAIALMGLVLETKNQTSNRHE